MKLVTFGIDNEKNLIIPFPVFVEPYTQAKFDFVPNRNSASTNFGY